jgi:hypothetical protein
MFGFGKKKPKTALDQFIFAVYGKPPPPKRANVEQAIALACDELLLGLIDREAVREHARALAASPIPYSTQDLAISVALNFFKDPQYVPHLGPAQLVARMKAILWTKDGLVVGPLMKSFEDTLYKLYKPAPPARSVSPPLPQKPIPAPDGQRHHLVRRLIHHRLSSEPVPGIPTPSLQQLQEDLPVEMLKQTSEFGILYIAEQYYGVRDTCSDEASAVQKLNELHSASFSLAGVSLPMMTSPFTLPGYCRHYFDTIPSSGESFSDDFIDDALEMIRQFYDR